MQFVGRVVDGEDECYEFQTLEDLDDIPEDIVTHWGIRDMMEDREAEEDEDWDAEEELQKIVDEKNESEKKKSSG